MGKFGRFRKKMSIFVMAKITTAFGIRGLSRKEIHKLIIKNEMYVRSLDNNMSAAAGSKKMLPKSPSCETLNSRVKVSRTFSLQEVGPSLLNADQWELIWQWIPARVTVMVPERIFATSEHGISLNTFFQRVEGWEPTLILVKAVSGELFGAYCSVDWEERHHHEKNLTYIGTGETFLFTLAPHAKKYEWVGIRMGEATPANANLFMSADSSQINIGGGGGTAIHLDENLDDGRCEHCHSFNNPPFVDGKDFKCASVEVYGFH